MATESYSIGTGGGSGGGGGGNTNGSNEPTRSNRASILGVVEEVRDVV